MRDHPDLLDAPGHRPPGVPDELWSADRDACRRLNGHTSAPGWTGVVPLLDNPVLPMGVPQGRRTVRLSRAD
eukprot:27180-Chlamydomonas_euryale.AAC.1